MYTDENLKTYILSLWVSTNRSSFIEYISPVIEIMFIFFFNVPTKAFEVLLKT